MKIRGFLDRDLAAVLAIQAQAPEVARWSHADYMRVVHGEFAGWIAEAESGVIGFLVARTVAEETEILNLAVMPESRRRGVGANLLQEALGWAARAGAHRAFLEVRESNRAAIGFYARHGFSTSGRRPRYYSNPSEDALVLACSLD